ncbi:ribonucleases P/MRP protein subunit POP1-like [Musa acuminata AAA Group]|uniref:ribonucleases P/MRP protein subunit POP1-like n=1 Tax=Musa acuminata AAA Group TaxID=214697 RepID=UPI0031D67993
MAAPREGSWGSRVESCPRMKRFRRPRRCPAGLVGGWSSEAIRLTGFCTAGDGTKRLRTHLWHAMRFTMVKHWGFYLPLGLHGRGQGSRAVLKWFKYGAHLDDASYCLPIQIEGPEDSILAVWRMVLFPSPYVHLQLLQKNYLTRLLMEFTMEKLCFIILKLQLFTCGNPS